MTQILVIEDDPTVRALLLKLLKAEGFEVLAAENGRIGVHLAQLHEPDLIICDVMMPKGNGYEVLEQLRQDPGTARIPFIFLSAKADRTDLRQGMDLGADDYLTKPFRRAELLSAIAARLAKQAAVTQPYINEMKRAAQNLSELAYRDPLTNLPNRIVVYHHLQDALKQAERSHGLLAVLYLNLAGFTQINSRLGFANGDRLLQHVAERLTSLPFAVESFVGRLDGDEFCLLLTELESHEQVTAALHRLQQALSEPFVLHTEAIRIQARIGIALCRDGSSSPETLLSRADAAMRYAKSQGRSYQFDSAEIDAQPSQERQLHSNLISALERQELQLHYQPQVNLITGRIIGAEALLRWHSSELGEVPPEQFLPIAEETGLAVPINEWVLQTACTQARAWYDASHLPIRMAINVSARQLQQQNLVQTVAAVLAQTRLAADQLVLEFTETSIMEEVDPTIATLQELQAMGVHISIDDFGTGYSSLNYLKRFPISILKIDRSVVSQITTDAKDAAIAKAIIAIAQSLQLKVVAEGVETEAQFALLRQSGCLAMQGFLFSPAIPAAEFEQLLLADQRLHVPSHRPL